MSGAWGCVSCGLKGLLGASCGFGRDWEGLALQRCRANEQRRADKHEPKQAEVRVPWKFLICMRSLPPCNSTLCWQANSAVVFHM